MRVTGNMYYKNVFGESNSRLSQSLFDVNKQIASGLKIQYAQEDIRVFTETMRLDNEITTLDQSKKSTVSAMKFSNQTDSVLNEFALSMDRARVLLVKASNSGVNSEASLDAIAYELRGLETHFKSLANTSINGQYLFSGSAIDTKPIADDGTYNGNDAILKAFTGSGTSQQYNISGQELFFGEKQSTRREITTNVIQLNLSSKYPDFTDAAVEGDTKYLKSSDTIRDLMGDTDNFIDVGTNKHFFYITGTKSNGSSFKEKLPMSDDEKISDLLKKIGDMYGNTPGVDVVNVSMNPSGQIIIEDKIRGSSSIEFHMVGATDFSGGAAANVTNIDDLGVGETSFNSIILGSSTATNPNLHVKEFLKSSMTSADNVAATNIIEGTLYDRVEFNKSGSKLSSNSSQIIKGSNAFATLSTKLSEVADLTQGTSGTLDGTSFVLEGMDVNGTPYSAQIDLATAGSTFTVGGNTYNIFNMGSPRVNAKADEVTYKQLSDVINMVVTGNLPATFPGTSSEYDTAIKDADLRGRTFLTNDGKLGFEEINASNTKATIALYDSNSGDFSVGADASVMTFNSNNALTVRDPKTDFFKTLNDVINAVENYKLYPDSNSGDARSIGIENAIAMIDELHEHVTRSHSQVGAQTNALSKSLERVEMLKMSSMTLRSSVIDTDMAEAHLTLAQLNTNYQAMLSTVGKISKLSLVNYL